MVSTLSLEHFFLAFASLRRVNSDGKSPFKLSPRDLNRKISAQQMRRFYSASAPNVEKGKVESDVRGGDGNIKRNQSFVCVVGAEIISLVSRLSTDAGLEEEEEEIIKIKLAGGGGNNSKIPLGGELFALSQQTSSLNNVAHYGGSIKQQII